MTYQLVFGTECPECSSLLANRLDQLARQGVERTIVDKDIDLPELPQLYLDGELIAEGVRDIGKAIDKVPIPERPASGQRKLQLQTAGG